MTLTADEHAEALAAAWARLNETRHYLRSAEAFTSGHDDCCDKARARAAVLAEQKRDLERREATLVSLLDKLEASR